MVNNENVELGYPDSFFKKIFLIGGDTKGITIPMELTKCLGLEVGDTVKVWIKKVHKE